MRNEGRDKHRTESERGQALKRKPAKEERDRSAEEVNADQPSNRGEKPKRAPKR